MRKIKLLPKTAPSAPTNLERSLLLFLYRRKARGAPQSEITREMPRSQRNTLAQTLDTLVARGFVIPPKGAGAYHVSEAGIKFSEEQLVLLMEEL